MSYEEEKQDRKIEQLEAEIERLRTENRELLHEIKDLSRIIDTGYKQLVCDRTGLNERHDLPEGIRRMAASVQELEAQLALTTSALENATRKPDVIDVTGTGNLDFSDTNIVDDLIKNGNHLRARAQKAETRIKELEDALAEYQRLGKTITGKVPCLTLHGDCGRCSAKMREVCGALEQIAGGKIGPDVKPRSWQITDERILAIENAISSCVLIERYTGQDLRQETTALRSMLEAGQ